MLLTHMASPPVDGTIMMGAVPVLTRSPTSPKVLPLPGLAGSQPSPKLSQGVYQGHQIPFKNCEESYPIGGGCDAIKNSPVVNWCCAVLINPCINLFLHFECGRGAGLLHPQLGI
jgi:hypothetical protein